MLSNKCSSSACAVSAKPSETRGVLAIPAANPAVRRKGDLPASHSDLLYTLTGSPSSSVRSDQDATVMAAAAAAPIGSAGLLRLESVQSCSSFKQLRAVPAAGSQCACQRAVQRAAAVHVCQRDGASELRQ